MSPVIRPRRPEPKLFNGPMNHGRGRPDQEELFKYKLPEVAYDPVIVRDPKIGVKIPKGIRLSPKNSYAWAARKQRQLQQKKTIDMEERKRKEKAHIVNVMKSGLGAQLVVTRGIEEATVRIRKLTGDIARYQAKPERDEAMIKKARFLLLCWESYLAAMSKHGVTPELGCTMNYARRFESIYTNKTGKPDFIIAETTEGKTVLRMRDEMAVHSREGSQ